MALLSPPLFFHRSRTYQWLVRLWFIGARTPRYRPLLRAEFADGDYFTQAEFLWRAGYYNAAVAMSRFAIEKRLKRLALISPEWEKFRCKTGSSMITFLRRAKAFDTNTKNKLNSFHKKANKYVHETVVDKDVAARILDHAESLRPALDAATRRMLAR